MERVRIHLKGDTGRLVATYLAIIMCLTLVFSGVIYSISSSQFDRPLPPRGQNGSNNFQVDEFTRSGLEDLFEERAKQARAELLVSLLVLNIAVLVGGAFLSYYLARRTLEPIEAAMEAQGRFVSDASHELRTPLTALQVTNEVALRKKKLTLAEAKELIGYNLAETVKLRSLSDALLGLAKQESADASKSDVKLAEAVLDAVQTLEPLATDKRISIHHDVPAMAIVGNQSAITQILRILLDNAIKYSPEASAVNVTVASAQHETIVSVQDEGPGVAAQHMPHIFDRFYRVDESRSSLNGQGSGLGLAIAKAIADKHGYVITATSQVGTGSTFSLHVPS
jgi:two-component system sensor histidine kinase CiaH